MEWIVLHTGKRSASENMALDSALLEDLKHETSPILHFYEWEADAATYGYFTAPFQFLNEESVKQVGLSLAKRPTGGGIVFHNCDLAFSVLVPASHPKFSLNPLDNYSFVNQRVIWAIDQFLKTTQAALLAEEPIPLDSNCRQFCMAKPTKYDVMIQGRKVGGAAQRKTRDGYLHQGSISLGTLPDEYWMRILKPGTRVLDGIKKNSFPLLGEKWDALALANARQTLIGLLEKAFTKIDNLSP